MQQSTSRFVERAGGQVAVSVFYPFNATADYSSYLLQARASGADTVALCNSSSELENCIKQASEFELGKARQRIVALIGSITSIHALGTQVTEGLLVSELFYWDLNERTRALMERLKPRVGGNWPNEEHASTYSAIMHYLKAAASVGPERAKASGAVAMAEMKQLPMDDDAAGPGRIRADGRRICDTYLFEVKRPSEQTQPWDVYKLLATVPGDVAFRPMPEGGCPLVPR